MQLKEHENAVLNAIDKAIKQLSAEDLEEFFRTVRDYLEEKMNED